MKLPAYLYNPIAIAALACLPCVAVSQQLSIWAGVYVREPAPCQEAPNASILFWDGVGISGPHSSHCTSVVLRKNGRRYNIRTSCSALGDGSPNPAGAPFTQSFALIRLSTTRFTIDKENQPPGTYRWCAKPN